MKVVLSVDEIINDLTPQIDEIFNNFSFALNSREKYDIGIRKAVVYLLEEKNYSYETSEDKESLLRSVRRIIFSSIKKTFANPNLSFKAIMRYLSSRVPSTDNFNEINSSFTFLDNFFKKIGFKYDEEFVERLLFESEDINDLIERIIKKYSSLIDSGKFFNKFKHQSPFLRAILTSYLKDRIIEVESEDINDDTKNNETTSDYKYQFAEEDLPSFLSYLENYYPDYKDVFLKLCKGVVAKIIVELNPTLYPSKVYTIKKQLPIIYKLFKLGIKPQKLNANPEKIMKRVDAYGFQTKEDVEEFKTLLTKRFPQIYANIFFLDLYAISLKKMVRVTKHSSDYITDAINELQFVANNNSSKIIDYSLELQFDLFSVVFPNGLKKYDISEDEMRNLLDLELKSLNLRDYIILVYFYDKNDIETIQNVFKVPDPFNYVRKIINQIIEKIDFKINNRTNKPIKTNNRDFILFFSDGDSKGFKEYLYYLDVLTGVVFERLFNGSTPEDLERIFGISKKQIDFYKGRIIRLYHFYLLGIKVDSINTSLDDITSIITEFNFTTKKDISDFIQKLERYVPKVYVDVFKRRLKGEKKEVIANTTYLGISEVNRILAELLELCKNGQIISQGNMRTQRFRQNIDLFNEKEKKIMTLVSFSSTYTFSKAFELLNLSDEEKDSFFRNLLIIYGDILFENQTQSIEVDKEKNGLEDEKFRIDKYILFQYYSKSKTCEEIASELGYDFDYVLGIIRRGLQDLYSRLELLLSITLSSDEQLLKLVMGNTN